LLSKPTRRGKILSVGLQGQTDHVALTLACRKRLLLHLAIEKKRFPSLKMIKNNNFPIFLFLKRKYFIEKIIAFQ